MLDDLPPHPLRDGRLFDANLHVLDRRVLDRDGQPILAVGDVEVRFPEHGGRPVLTGLVLGSGLVGRFFGVHRPASAGEVVDLL